MLLQLQILLWAAACIGFLKAHIMHAQQIVCNQCFFTVLQLLELEVSDMYYITGTLPSSWSSLTQVSTYTVSCVLATMHTRDTLPCNEPCSGFAR